MATLTETSVRVVIELVRDGADQSVHIVGYSRDISGNVMRTGERFNVTSLLTPAQVAAGLALLDAAEGYYKTLWQIT